MPIVNADVKSLELVVFAELADDAVMKEEIRNKADLHKNNQDAFNLPDRITAKRFVFKLIYGATAYGFSTDPDFVPLGLSEKDWQNVIDAFYKKYSGGAKWHKRIVQEAMEHRKLTIPSGRYFPFNPLETPRGLKWPITQIKNYPVQGFGADLVMIARLEARRLLNEHKIEALLIGTIHDSIVADCSGSNVQRVAECLLESVQRVPQLCKQIWKYDFSLPLTAEVQYGPNKKDLTDIAF